MLYVPYIVRIKCSSFSENVKGTDLFDQLYNITPFDKDFEHSHKFTISHCDISNRLQSAWPQSLLVLQVEVISHDASIINNLRISCFCAARYVRI